MGSIHRESASASGVVATRVWKAETALDRMRGLLGRPALKAGEGMLIEPCSSVHTLGMGYALDVIFIDAHDKVVKLCRHVVPLRMAFGFGARATLEMAAGEIDRLQIAVGDRLQWRH